MDASEHAHIALAWLTVSDEESPKEDVCKLLKSYGERQRMH